MKKPLLLSFILLLLQTLLAAQVQWFQNQDGNNSYPNGTVGTSVYPLTSTSFVATYLWHADNDQFTWKLSKTNHSGAEQRTFYITGTTAQIETRVGKRNVIYVLEKNYPLGSDPVYTLFKLDSNLNVRSQKVISFEGGYSVFNLNAFKLDDNDNIYLAGDGQYPDGPGFLPASFMLKADRNINTAWMKMDSTQTSYSDIHIDDNGYVWVVEDYFASFPDIRITRFAASGHLKWRKTITTDAGRFSLSSALAEDDQLIIYGGKAISETAQGVYLWKIGRNNGNIVYKKTHFPANGVQLTDLKQDRTGNIFALATQYYNNGRMLCRVGRISSWNGALQWSRYFPYEQDSCNLFKLVVNDNDRFYMVGEKKRNNILSRGFAIRMKKNGQPDGNYISPDSVSYLRSHWLTDGITDRNNQLISTGITQDMDTITYQSTYLRSFVIKLGQTNNNHHGCGDHHSTAISSEAAEEETGVVLKTPVLYPNPAQQELTVSNLLEEKYDRMAVYNLQGSLVLQRTINTSSIKIDVSGLPGGVYLLQLQSGILQKQTTLRFVVQK